MGEIFFFLTQFYLCISLPRGKFFFQLPERHKNTLLVQAMSIYNFCSPFSSLRWMLMMSVV